MHTAPLLPCLVRSAAPKGTSHFSCPPSMHRVHPRSRPNTSGKYSPLTAYGSYKRDPHVILSPLSKLRVDVAVATSLGSQPHPSQFTTLPRLRAPLLSPYRLRAISSPHRRAAAAPPPPPWRSSRGRSASRTRACRRAAPPWPRPAAGSPRPPPRDRRRPARRWRRPTRSFRHHGSPWGAPGWSFRRTRRTRSRCSWTGTLCGSPRASPCSRPVRSPASTSRASATTADSPSPGTAACAWSRSRNRPSPSPPAPCLPSQVSCSHPCAHFVGGFLPPAC